VLRGMNDETKLGLAAVGLMVLCCAGPLLLSLLASGAVLAVLGGLQTSVPLLVVAAILGAIGVLLVRRGRSSGSAGSCPAPPRSAEVSATTPRGDGS
jgi:hypothetical protein